MHAPPELEHSIRNTLGCGCPGEAFESIEIHRQPLQPDDTTPAWWIEVGGRLLIAVTEGDDQDLPAGRLVQICADATRRRDRGGFNRFRLVTVADPATAAIGAIDERIHLHIGPPADLPPLTVTQYTEPS